MNTPLFEITPGTKVVDIPQPIADIKTLNPTQVKQTLENLKKKFPWDAANIDQKHDAYMKDLWRRTLSQGETALKKYTDAFYLAWQWTTDNLCKSLNLDCIKPADTIAAMSWLREQGIAMSKWPSPLDKPIESNYWPEVTTAINDLKARYETYGLSVAIINDKPQYSQYGKIISAEMADKIGLGNQAWKIMGDINRALKNPLTAKK